MPAGWRSISAHDRLSRSVSSRHTARRAPASTTRSPSLTVSRWPTCLAILEANEANGEDKRDGSNDNHINIDGMRARPTTPRLVALRLPAPQNQLAFSSCALGTPLSVKPRRRSALRKRHNTPIARTNDTWLGERGHPRQAVSTISLIFRRPSAALRGASPASQPRWLDGLRKDGSFGVLVADSRGRWKMKEADRDFPKADSSPMCSPEDKGKRRSYCADACTRIDRFLTLPKMAEYKDWQQLLNTTESASRAAAFAGL